jgi:hypothetical protein
VTLKDIRRARMGYLSVRCGGGRQVRLDFSFFDHAFGYIAKQLASRAFFGIGRD